MKISVILGHPYEKSFNAAIADAVVKILIKNNHTVFFHNLYLENFDPVMTGEEILTDSPKNSLVKIHCDEIKNADGIVIVHPNWWGQPPAILKGWVDRVLHHGLAYQFTEDDSGGGIPKGLLKAEKAIIFNTSNTGESREFELFGDPLERLWKDCIFNYCGVSRVFRKTYRIISDSTYEQRSAWLDDVKKIIEEHFAAAQVA